MRFGSHVVRFDMRGVPVVGNTVTGSLVGLTPEGASLCDVMLRRDVNASEVPVDCEQLFAYLAGHGFDAGESDSVRITSAYLHVSNRCNLSCMGCYSADRTRNRAADPTLDQLLHALGVLSQLGVIRLVISGGEPFLREDLQDIARGAREHGMTDIVVLTNGTLCGDETLRLLAGNVDMVSVSFDGVADDDPSFIRGEQLFGVLIDTVKRIQGAGIHAHLLPTLHARNIRDVPAYITLSKRLGCTVGFSVLSGSKSDLGELFPGDACLANLADLMIEVAQKGDIASIDDAFNPVRTLAVRSRCGAGRQAVSVASDGTVYPCHMLHKPEFMLGNAFTGEAESIANSLSQYALPSVDEIEGCPSCENRYFCGGGCRARAYYEHGCMTKRDPYCEYYRHAINRTVAAFAKSSQRWGE